MKMLGAKKGKLSQADIDEFERLVQRLTDCGLELAHPINQDQLYGLSVAMDALDEGGDPFRFSEMLSEIGLTRVKNSIVVQLRIAPRSKSDAVRALADEMAKLVVEFPGTRGILDV